MFLDMYTSMAHELAAEFAKGEKASWVVVKILEHYFVFGDAAKKIIDSICVDAFSAFPQPSWAMTRISLLDEKETAVVSFNFAHLNEILFLLRNAAADFGIKKIVIVEKIV